MATLDDDLTVSGAFGAGNWAQGFVRLSPEPFTAVSVTLSGLNLTGEGKLFPQLTARTEYPWFRVREVTFRFLDDEGNLIEYLDQANSSVNQIEVYLYRTDSHPTNVHWLIFRGLT